MDIKKIIIEAESFGAKEATVIVDEFLLAPAELSAFIMDFLGDDVRFRQRGAWVLVNLAQNHQDKLLPYIDLFMSALKDKPEDSIKRNVLRIFQYMELPNAVHERLINYCFDVLVSKEEAIAIQVFAMSVLPNLISNYPELQKELILILEDKLPYASAGFKARARTILERYY